MQVTAWNNGKHHATGAGYGLKIGKDDRDRFFQKSWGSVLITLPGVGKEVELNINKVSFWNDSCRELISKDIGRWLIGRNYAPWPLGQPPSFNLHKKQGNHFELCE